MSIGQRIKQARKAKGMSQRSLAEEAAISAMAVSKYERDLDIPSSSVILRLVQALEISVDFLFRPNTVSVQLEAFRKHSTLGVKEQQAIQMRIKEWLERYYEIESFFPDEQIPLSLPLLPSLQSIDQVEEIALEIRIHWKLGLDAIENLTQLLEDRGVKIGLVAGFMHFDACTFMANDNPVIVTKDDIPGDRQRFNLGHELGHLVLDIEEGLNVEAICNRFVGAFLVPAQVARFELGSHRSNLDINELYLLKQKYGLSMQAWIYRAMDLEIISQNAASSLFKRFRASSWHRHEPGKAFPTERSLRLERLVYRALAEDLISRSKAQELLGEPVQRSWTVEAMHQNGVAVSFSH